MKKFTHLHVHTEYSVQDGASTIKSIVAKAKKLGMEAVAITDHGNMYGTTNFYKECKNNGIKPIIGCEVYTENIDGEKKANHLVLLAKNEIGYKNLLKIVTFAFDNFHRRPQVTWENLRKYSEGLICLSACLGGEIPRALRDGDYAKAKEVALSYKEIFGDDFYLEVQRHDIAIEERVNLFILKLSKELNIKVVATGDSHFTNAEDKETQDVLLCLQVGKTLSSPDRWSFDGNGHHFQTQDEMYERFSDVPEVLEITQEIVDKIDVELKLNEVSLPKFDVPAEFKTEADYFKHLVTEGFKFRYERTEHFNDPVYRDRLEYEIGIILDMGFEGYFLIVQDFIMFAKNNGIMVGPGRGSCVGSLAAYCLQITDLDPIPLNLLFERFLNPERVSNPDMDIDFEFERREEVVNYVIEKYGEESVCGIITFGTFGAKGVVRDVARVYDMPYTLGDKIAKAIPAEVGMTLSKALNDSPDFRNMYIDEPDVKKIVDRSMKLEGLVRHVSTHACGKVIAPEAIVNFMPEAQVLDKKTKQRVRVSQMTDVEEMGLLKFDFLGLRTMSVIGNSLKMANKKRKGEGKKEIKYLEIPLTNWEVYKYIGTGETFGVFQLESPGMQQLMKDMFADVDGRAKYIKGLKITEDKKEKKLNEFGFELFERLVAAVSLYRPGPLEYIPQYLEGMKGPDEIVYDCPELEEILKPTYGTIVYQEQVQMIVRKLAGYSLGRGDLIRRAMGKKKADVMAQEKEYFIHGKVDENGVVEVDGCIRRGISEEAASVIWDKMEDFAKYAFNKSHAGAYAMIAYITAWIKYFYPVEFMTSMLNSFISNSDKLKLYIRVCLKMGIELLPPDVNKSREYFSVEDEKTIRFGLMGLKNLGKTSIKILEERETRGEFKGYQDFAERMAVNEKINKKDLESLIYSGAVDNFEGSRKAKLKILPDILEAASFEKKNHNSGQITIFDIDESLKSFKIVEIPKEEEFLKKFKLEKEKEFAGFYITEHPLDEYEEFFEGEGITEIGLFTQSGAEDDSDNEDVSFKNQFNDYHVRFAGIVTNFKTYYTKKDNKPIFSFNVEDRTGEIRAVMFSDKVELNKGKIYEGNIIMLDGTIKDDDRGLQVIVQAVSDIDALKKKQIPKAVWVKITQESQFHELDKILAVERGTIPVYVKHGDKKLQANRKIALNYSSYAKLTEAFGENMVITYVS